MVELNKKMKRTNNANLTNNAFKNILGLNVGLKESSNVMKNILD
jgi:hypothetical protein